MRAVICQSVLQVRAMLLELRVGDVRGFNLSALDAYRWHPGTERVDIDRSDGHVQAAVAYVTPAAHDDRVVISGRMRLHSCYADASGAPRCTVRQANPGCAAQGPP